MIARLTQGTLYPCPKKGIANGRYHTNLPKYYENHLSVAAGDGYYPVEYTEKPEGDYISSWEIVNNVIVQVWTPYTPEPEPIDIDIEKLRSDVDYIAMMTDVDLDGGLE